MRQALPHLAVAILTAAAAGATAVGLVNAPDQKPFSVTSPSNPAATSQLRSAAAATANAQSYTVTASETIIASGRTSTVTYQILYQAPNRTEILTAAGIFEILIGDTAYLPLSPALAGGTGGVIQTQNGPLTGAQAEGKYMTSTSTGASVQQNPGALFLNILEHVDGVHRVGAAYVASGSGTIRSAEHAGVSGAATLAGESSASATISATVSAGFVSLVSFGGTNAGRSYSVRIAYDKVNSSAPVAAPPASDIVTP